MNTYYYTAVLSLTLFTSLLSARADISKKSEQINTAVEYNTVSKVIDYSWGYEKDAVNFTEQTISVKGALKRTLILTNIHGDMPLNLTNTFDPKKRTLQWGNPYEYSAYRFRNISDAHSHSALLRQWSNNKYRTRVTFVIIPKNKGIEYIIGYAAPQSSQSKNSYESTQKESGYGIQLRLKYLPVGTKVITVSLLPQQQISKSKKDKKYSLSKIFSKAIATINQKEIKVDPSLATPLQDYVITDPKDFTATYLMQKGKSIRDASALK